MRFAYADPPYPGQSARWYRDHPDYAGEVDHTELIAQLEAGYPDGWALSTSAEALQRVLALCPPGVRIGSWHKTNSDPPGNRGGWWWSWEPVIIRGGRPGSLLVRDVLRCGYPASARFPGAKPAQFLPVGIRHARRAAR